MDNRDSNTDLNPEFSTGFISDALDKFNFTQDSIWSNHDQQINDPGIVYNTDSYHCDTQNFSKAGFNSNHNAYNYDDNNMYNSHVGVSQGYMMATNSQIPNEYPHQIYEETNYANYDLTNYSNMGNAVNSNLPLAEMMPSRISAPQQLQQNSMLSMGPVQISASMAQQMSDQKSSKRQSLLIPNSKMLSKIYIFYNSGLQKFSKNLEFKEQLKIISAIGIEL
jgi:hypothetical protein